MEQRDHGPDGELPFEAEPDVEQNRDQGVAGRLNAGPKQILADLGADELDPPVTDVLAELLGKGGLNRVDRREWEELKSESIWGDMLR